jgi:hypothetical protein
MGPRIYPSDQNVSQLLPAPTGSTTPTPTPTITPTPTPTPTPGVPIITTNLLLYADGQSISYSGSGTTWVNLAPPIAPGTGDMTLIGQPEFNYRPNLNYFSFNGLSQYSYGLAFNPTQDYTGLSYTWGGWFKLCRGPRVKSLLAFGIGLTLQSDDFLGGSLNLYKDVNDFITVQIWNQINVSPSFPVTLTGSTITSTTKVPNNEWCYIVASYQKNSTVTIYLNGLPVTTGLGPLQGQLIRAGNTTENVGWNICYGGFVGDNVPFKLTRMEVGDIEAYKTVLSDVQVLSNYNAQKNKYI